MSDLPAMRASDADRDRAVELLRDAAERGMLTVEELEQRVHTAYTAQTRNELEPLLADIATAGSALAAPMTGNWPVVKQGPGGSRWCVAIMGGHERKGGWRVGPRCTVLNVMGGSDVDLTQAELSSHETRINVYSIMGGGEVRVPLGVEVHVSPLALMGGNDVKLGEEIVVPGGPVIRLRLFSLMGGVSVRRGPKKSKKERRLREAERRRELEP